MLSSHGKLFKQFSLSGCLKLFNVGVGFAVTVLLVRLLPAAAFGQYAFYMALVTILTIPSVMGVTEVVVREVSKYKNDKDKHYLKRVIVWGYGSVIITSFVVVLGMWLLYGLMFRKDTDRYIVIAWMTIIIVMMSLSSLRNSILIGLMLPIYGQVSELLFKPVLLVSLLGLVMIFGVGFSVVSALQINFFATLCAFLLGSYLLYIKLPAMRGVLAGADYNRIKKWSASAVSLGFISGMYVINQQVDLILMGLMSTNEQAGVYKVISQIAIFIIFGQQMVRSVIAPKFSHLWNAGKLKELEQLAVLSSRVSLSIAIGFFLALVIGGEFMLSRLFGDVYATGYFALMILCAGQLFNAITGSVGNLLNMCGKELDSLKALIAGVGLNVIFGLILIPHYGAIGAAIGTSIGLVVCNAMLWRTVRIHIKIKPSAFRV